MIPEPPAPPPPEKPPDGWQPTTLGGFPKKLPRYAVLDRETGELLALRPFLEQMAAAQLIRPRRGELLARAFFNP